MPAGPRWRASEVSAFCEEITLLLAGGFSIHEGIGILYQEMDDKRRKGIYQEIDTKTRQGMPLYQALEESTVFPIYMVHMVKIGETTGKLEEVMASLARYYEREHSLKEGIRSVVVYPIMLFVMIGILLLVLVVKLLPIFQSVFHELESNVSKESGNRMATSILLGEGMVAIVLIVCILIIAAAVVHKSKGGRMILYRIGVHLPYIRNILYKMGMNQFISAMSLMIGSGMEGKKALEWAMDLIEHPGVKKKVFNCQRRMRNHEALETSLRDSGLITGMNGRMIRIGERTGALPAVLERLAVAYEEEMELSLSRMSLILETALVVLLSVMIGVILISILYPLISILSSIG